MDEVLLKKIEKLKKERGSSYQPRTKHKRSDGWAKYTNRLFLETSPYLLQHAHNPVNWYPWGDEAFQTAKTLNRPILLSIGYSTCHWCHVMEEESFEDEEIARCMNENYVAVKVDREERPDLDAVYMSAVQAMTGNGGWPMTVWLDSDKKPFFGGTYFPARDGDRGAATGFLTLLNKIRDVYYGKPELIKQSGQKLVNTMRQMLSSEAGDMIPAEDLLSRSIDYYQENFDNTNGGILGAPKFPSSLPIRVLLRHYRRTGDPGVLKMVKLTLEKMAFGGMYDHVGGGFHRYATDDQWLVPHFEKMLYDNALLVPVYLEAYQVTGSDLFRKTAQDILRYVGKEMTSPDGAFYSATDADSETPEGEREEGYYFTWTPEELAAALGEEKSRIVSEYFGVSPAGNFEGRNIFHRTDWDSTVARRMKISERDLTDIVSDAKAKLYEIRNDRPSPLRDEKILTAWNGLMISAYARAAVILGDAQYSDIATRSAEFLLKCLFKDGKLYRSYMDGKARHHGYLEDNAFLISALLDLYEATQKVKWLDRAISLDHTLALDFEDGEKGGFFMTGDDHEELIAREKPNYDGAVPSGNSIALINLLRLSAYTTRADYGNRAERALKAFSSILNVNPARLSEMLLAIDFYHDIPKEIVIVTPAGRNRDAEPFVQELRKTFLPNRTLTIVSEGKELERQARYIPFLKGKGAKGGKVTVYVCEKGSCQLPTTQLNEFSEQIKTVSKMPKAS